MENLTPEYITALQEIIHNDDKEKARELLKGLHPADIAELYQQMKFSTTRSSTNAPNNFRYNSSSN